MYDVIDLTANLLLEYGMIDNEAVIEAETARLNQRKKIREMADRLGGIDADLDDLLQALLTIHDEYDLEAPVDANTLIIYGVIDGDVIRQREKTRLEMIYLVEALRTMDVNNDNLLEAIQNLRDEYKRKRA